MGGSAAFVDLDSGLALAVLHNAYHPFGASACRTTSELARCVREGVGRPPYVNAAAPAAPRRERRSAVSVASATRTAAASALRAEHAARRAAAAAAAAAAPLM